MSKVPPDSQRCDFGWPGRCRERATHVRRTQYNGGKVQRDKACAPHVYPTGQTSDNAYITATPIKVSAQ